MQRWLTKFRKFISSERTKQIAIITGGVFLILNVLTYAAYRHRTYPNTTINNHHIGSIAPSQLPKQIDNFKLLPNEITLTSQDKTSNINTAELGVKLDNASLISQSTKHRSWIPVFNFFTTHRLPLFLSIDKPTFGKSFDTFTQTHHRDPVDSQITVTNGTFVIKPEAPGYKLDESSTLSAIVSALENGQSKVELPVEITQPAVKQDMFKSDLNSLQKQQALSLTFRYQAKSKKLSSQEISALYMASKGSFVISDTQIKSQLLAIAKSFGVNPQNINEGVNAVKHALQAGEALDFSFVPVPASRSFTYCVQARGVDVSNLMGLRSKLQAVYGDERGWSLGGQVSYSEVSSGCNFTVWLTAANQMSSFGSICDSNWSCTVSPNVIINFDRWQTASTAWNSSGGNLDDYRAMVINHETGHWLGFGHRNCGGPGQLAPVMQQQSIDLQGCKFNPWPTAPELDTLRGWLNI